MLSASALKKFGGFFFPLLFLSFLDFLPFDLGFLFFSFLFFCRFLSLIECAFCWVVGYLFGVGSIDVLGM